MDRFEEFLEKIVNDESMGEWKFTSRLEEYLFCILVKGTAEATTKYEELRKAITDKKLKENSLEKYLDAIYKKK